MVISVLLYKYLRMASIKLDNLAKTKTKALSGPTYTYTDLYLDLQYDKVPNAIGIGNTEYGNIDNNRDLRIAPDELAIKNSLINLFNTQPGQRILIPRYGCNLMGYVFEQITLPNADALGRTLEEAIKVWEPRVTLNRLNVMGDPENNQYNVTIKITIPSLSQRQVSFTGILASGGFTETNNNK